MQERRRMRKNGRKWRNTFIRNIAGGEGEGAFSTTTRPLPWNRSRCIVECCWKFRASGIGPTSIFIATSLFSFDVSLGLRVHRRQSWMAVPVPADKMPRILSTWRRNAPAERFPGSNRVARFSSASIQFRDWLARNRYSRLRFHGFTKTWRIQSGREERIVSRSGQMQGEKRERVCTKLRKSPTDPPILRAGVDVRHASGSIRRASRNRRSRTCVSKLSLPGPNRLSLSLSPLSRPALVTL